LDLTKLIIKPIIATIRIIGSASINIGIVPDVNVTIVDENKTRQIPDAKIIKPFWSFCFICPIVYVIRQTTTPTSIYKSNTLRGIVPPAFP
jgi:hypothetical protein